MLSYHNTARCHKPEDLDLLHVFNSYQTPNCCYDIVTYRLQATEFSATSDEFSLIYDYSKYSPPGQVGVVPFLAMKRVPFASEVVRCDVGKATPGFLHQSHGSLVHFTRRRNITECLQQGVEWLSTNQMCGKAGTFCTERMGT